MAALYVVAASPYEDGAKKFAIVADDDHAYAVNAGGGENVSQSKRIERLAARTQRKPALPLDWIRLAAMNMSSVTFSPPVAAPNIDAAHDMAVAALRG